MGLSLVAFLLIQRPGTGSCHLRREEKAQLIQRAVAAQLIGPRHRASLCNMDKALWGL